MADSDFVVSPFKVIVDTREQHPYHFRGITSDSKQKKVPLVVQTISEGIPTGDYSIEGMADIVAVERKSHSDFASCCGIDRDRFVKQIERLNELETSAVVIEAEWASILRGTPHSNIMPKTIFCSVIAWQQRYPNVHWWFCPTRQFAMVTTYRILDRTWRDIEAGKRAPF